MGSEFAAEVIKVGGRRRVVEEFLDDWEKVMQ
jgi:hypothetical protein